MSGVPVPVVSRLLGHSNVRMTLRYAHLADKEIEAAAERIGEAMALILAISAKIGIEQRDDAIANPDTVTCSVSR